MFSLIPRLLVLKDTFKLFGSLEVILGQPLLETNITFVFKIENIKLQQYKIPLI